MTRLHSRTMRKVLLSLVVLVSLSGTAEADFVFGEATNLGSAVNSAANEQTPSISADGLELYFADHLYAPLRPGGHGSSDLWVATRATKADPWDAAVNLGPVVNSSSADEHPSISADGLSLYFGSSRGGGSGAQDLWVTTRATKDSPWTAPVNLGPTVNSQYGEWTPDISADGLSLYFADYMSYRPGGYGLWDIYVATRPTVSDPWGAPVNLGPNVNSPQREAAPDVSSDGLVLFLNTDRAGGLGGSDLWMTKRQTPEDPWGPLMNLGPRVNTSGFEASPKISADGSMLYFCSERPGTLGDVDLWQVPIEPVVDLNGDGVVNGEDMAILLYHWGQDESLCDIGPMPWGDGVVDVQDLIVLAKHLGPGLELTAHWKLDEGGRTIAHDSVGGSDATVVGGATWRPDGGMVDGALELDGVDGYVATDFAADPKAGPVRVVCWVQTDLAGGVIVSQKPGAAFGSNWLAIDPVDGTLVSEMMFPLPALSSTAVVADGQWHEVSAEWDGTYRRLWVDKREVAKDAQPTALPPFSWNGTLTLGAGANLEADSFFAGMIDDVRIYNRAVRP